METPRQLGRHQVQLHRTRAVLARRRCEARRGLDLAARSDRGEQAAARPQRVLDLVQVERDLAEPDDVRAQRLCAAGWGSVQRRGRHPEIGRPRRSGRQRALASSPCMWSKEGWPARSCRSSTFWVTTRTGPAWVEQVLADARRGA